MRGGASTVLGSGLQPAGTNPIFSLHPAGTTPAQVGATTGTLEGLRQIARDAYARGSLIEALDLQNRIRDAARASGTPSLDDFLFLGLLNYAARRIEDGVVALREGVAAYPTNAPLHENLAVFLLAIDDVSGAIDECNAALTLGSDSPNVHDCLADAYNRIGRTDLAIRAGRDALEVKDRKFSGRDRLAAIPASLPPAFDPTHPEENIISYCLWGNEPRYQVPLLENVRILPHLFPGWTIRLYHDFTVDPAYLADLGARGVQMRPMALPPGVPIHRKLLWRFDVIADPSVKRFLIRDADSLLTVKERVAVDAWMQSRYHFHAMRDWFTHTDLLLAGMWGGVGNILPGPVELMRHYTAWRVENDHVDQDMLAETVWPTIRNDVLIHDSIYTGALGSVPFPPFGHSIPGNHIGQNAFLHFTKTG